MQSYSGHMNRQRPDGGISHANLPERSADSSASVEKEKVKVPANVLPAKASGHSLPTLVMMPTRNFTLADAARARAKAKEQEKDPPERDLAVHKTQSAEMAKY